MMHNISDPHNHYPDWRCISLLGIIVCFNLSLKQINHLQYKNKMIGKDQEVFELKISVQYPCPALHVPGLRRTSDSRVGVLGLLPASSGGTSIGVCALSTS